MNNSTQNIERAAVKRISAIDLGTNSFHAIIVDVFNDGSFQKIDDFKVSVQLATGGVGKKLTQAAMKRGWNALKSIKTLCDSHQVDVILAYATSAIREAENGGYFIQKVKDDLDIKIKPIPGIMEAELIGYAVQHGINIGEKPNLLVDIGGGSVEFIIADSKKFHFLDSQKIGAARMANKFRFDDPISSKDIQILEDYYRVKLNKIAKLVSELNINQLIGSSGTMENIAQMVAFYRGMPIEITLNELELEVSEILEFYDYFIKLGSKERSKVPGLDSKRVNIINPGIILLKLIIQEFGIEKIKISTQALREGIIIRYLQKETDLLSLAIGNADPRKRCIFELLRKCRWNEEHSRHVAKLALQIFDALEAELKLLPADKELLQYAAYLHDIGYYISHSAHHKHALYIIRNADLKGFSEEEIEIMAHVARYHRKSHPKITHSEYQSLPLKVRRRIRKLAAILRVADGLDRSQFQNVEKMELDLNPDAFFIQISGKEEVNLELWGAKRKSGLLREVLRRKINIESIN